MNALRGQPLSEHTVGQALYADQHTEARSLREILAETTNALAFQMRRADLAERALHRSTEAHATITLPALRSITETVDMSRLDPDARAIAADALIRLCEYLTCSERVVEL